MTDRIPAALREARDAVELDSFVQYSPKEVRAYGARCMAAALRWAHKSHASKYHRKTGCEDCMAIAALEQEAKNE